MPLFSYGLHHTTAVAQAVLPQSIDKLQHPVQGHCPNLTKGGSKPQIPWGTDRSGICFTHPDTRDRLWGQALTYHPHIHMIVPAGGLSEDGTEWVRAPKKFFLPVKALSKVFRGVMWTLLEKEIRTGNIRIPDHQPPIQMFKKQLYEKNWNVYAKKSLAGPQSVVQYLGKYTHRVAISNNRIVEVAQGKVSFRWKDYRKGLKNQLLCLDADEFIGRFMKHILPSGFYKIRYYGLLASANRSKKEQCMNLIDKPQHIPLLQAITTKQVIKVVTGKDPDQCPKCKKGKLMPHTILDPV